MPKAYPSEKKHRWADVRADFTRDKRKPQGKHDELVNQTAPSHSEEKELSSTATTAIVSKPSCRQVTLDDLLDQAPQENGRKHSNTHRADQPTRLNLCSDTPRKEAVGNH